jgi:hypothetical protein
LSLSTRLMAVERLGRGASDFPGCCSKHRLMLRRMDATARK